MSFSSRRIWIPALFAVCSLVFLNGVFGDDALRIGLYKSTGIEGIKQSLDKNDGFKSEIIKKLDLDTLFKYDAVVIGSIKGGLPRAAWNDALEIYVKSGGGVLIEHDATGFRGWRKPLFPSLFQGVARGVGKEMLIVDKKHPITKGLPEKFEHAYCDHIALKRAYDGKTLIANTDGKPVVVVGRMGDGRIVGNGMVTGYAFVRPDGNKSQSPEGGEEMFLLNSLRWLCEKPLTNLPADELSKRKRRFANELTIRQSAKVVPGETKIRKTVGSKKWFHKSRINEQGFVHPPVELLPGRFFMFDGTIISATNRSTKLKSYKETVGMLQQMKWLGVTDVICFTGGLFRFNYPTNMPDPYYPSRAHTFIVKYKNFNMLARMEKACAEVGLGLWCFWHPNMNRLDNKHKKSLKQYMVKDGKGVPYSYYADVLNPKTLEYCKKVIDELAARYNKHGALKGIFLDELWHPFGTDYLEDDIDKFVAFSEKHYKTSPPSDIALKFAKGPAWHDPEDVWWRRYLIWRDTHIAKFTKNVTRYANRKGLKIMAQPAFPLNWDKGWFWGVGNTKRLCSSGNMLWTYLGRTSFIYEDYPKNRTIFGTHTNMRAGNSMVSLIRGNYGSLFAFCNNWAPILFGKSPRSIEVMRKTIRSNREWFQSKKLDGVAVLLNEYGLTLSQREPAQVFQNNNKLIRERLSYSVRTSMILVDNTEFYKNYKVLIAPKHTLEYISLDVYRKLRRYVKNGGLLILCEGKVSTSNEDHTNVVDRTTEFVGIKRSGRTLKSGKPLILTNEAKPFKFPAYQYTAVKIMNKKVSSLAKSAGVGNSMITSFPIGKGAVVSINFDITSLLADEGTVDKTIDLFAEIEKKHYTPALLIKGKLKVVSTLKKGNWIVASFLARKTRSDDSGKSIYPASGKLYVDTKKLGLNFKRFRVYSLARNREMFPQGKNFSMFGQKYWTSEILRDQGIDVVLMPDSESELKLECKSDNGYINRYVLPSWRQLAVSREYEHEIIAVAPADEVSMPLKTKKRK